jgi:hypothetical protein
VGGYVSLCAAALSAVIIALTTRRIGIHCLDIAESPEGDGKVMPGGKVRETKSSFHADAADAADAAVRIQQIHLTQSRGVEENGFIAGVVTTTGY